MAEEPEYYRAQPLPPHEGAAQGYRQGSPFGPGGGAAQWGQPGTGAPAVNVNVVGGKSALLAYVLWFFLIPLWLLMFLDIFVIPLRVAALNARLARRVSGY